VIATFCILGLDFCVLTYWGSAALLLSLESFYNYARGHCKAARSFTRVVRARSEATRGVHSGLLSMLGSKTTLAVVRELSWGILGREEGGLKGIGASGSGYNEVLALRMLNVVDCIERGRCAKLLESASAPHPVVVVLLFQVCLHACICTSTCLWTCMHTYAQTCICACTCIYACAGARVRAHAYACVCMCTRMHRWRVLVVTPQRVRWCLGRAYAPMCMCMHVHAYMHGRVCAWPAVSVTCTLKQVFRALVHGRVFTLHRCVFTPTYTSVTRSLQVVHVCVYVYMCVYACMCLWMRVCVYDIA